MLGETGGATMVWQDLYATAAAPLEAAVKGHGRSAFTQKCSQGISVPSGVPGIVLRRLTGIKGAALRRR